MAWKWKPPTLSLVWVGTLAFFAVEMTLFVAYAAKSFERLLGNAASARFEAALRELASGVG